MLSPSIQSSSAELQLALLLSRRPAEDADTSGLADSISTACSQVRTWDLFLKLVDHHRIVSLVSRNAGALASVLPPDVYAHLRARASRNAIEAFRYLAEVQRLLSLLEQAGIKASVIKGVALSIQAYSSVSTRDVGDIDLLIHAEDALQADRILLQASAGGRALQRSEPVFRQTPKRCAEYLSSFKDFTYQPSLPGDQSEFEVDLHWRLFRNPFTPGNSLSEQPLVNVFAGSIKLPTFSMPVNLLYLSVHGAVDGWSRLKSVADVAALWNGLGVEGQSVAMQLAREVAVLPYLHSALRLAEQWIGGFAVPDPGLSARQAKLSNSITARARRLMEENDFLPPLRETSSWKMKQYEASLSPSTRYRAAVMRRVLYRPRMWSRFDLPDRWFHLYPLLSPLEWLLFRAERLSRGRED